MLIHRLVSVIHNIAVLCEEDEKKAFSLITSSLYYSNETQDADFYSKLFQIQKRINTLNDKISNLDLYCGIQNMPEQRKETILSALESSLRAELDSLDKCKAAKKIIPSNDDIRQFIKVTRRYGYIKEIDRTVLEDLVDVIYVTKKENDSRYQRDRITIKFKYIGVFSVDALKHGENEMG